MEEYNVKLVTTHAKHFDIGKPHAHTVPGEFNDVLLKALESVNSSLNVAEDKAVRLSASPDDVEIHDVMISLAKANAGVTFTKAIIDRVLTAYREITNLR